ncbi:MAG: CRISPR-associated protein Cas5 [Deltaproteobacteria bacterium]|nr:CRISPR-associated protein Cas5 [Deltaproteobacteria bacterium]MBW2071449.1 CRISPR-associated protein Cas5 [Deltaproteobacteria bacterium]
MEVLKIVAEGVTTSFRYPHFMQGIQPTFRMPPPATIYGHVCSALGEWFDPTGIMFGVQFYYKGVFEDMEHVHIVSPSTGRLPGTKVLKALEGKVNPFRREILAHPSLTLYISRPQWLDAFRHPRYAVVLGRSQDLFTYQKVEVVSLEPRESAYFEATLAPYGLAKRTGAGRVVTMPRFVDYLRGREPFFGRYVILERRVHTRDFLLFSEDPEPRYWTDPTGPVVDGDAQGVILHTWVGEDDSVFRLA